MEVDRLKVSDFFFFFYPFEGFPCEKICVRMPQPLFTYFVSYILHFGFDVQDFWGQVGLGSFK